jgi:dihydrofolate reductase
MILAATHDEVIGRDNDLPWHLPDDLRRFRQLTAGHAVVVGRRTHESIITRLGRPLPGRISVVVTREARSADGPVIYASSVPVALGTARAIEEFAGRDEVFVIGGAQVYIEALPEVGRVYLTRVHAEVDGDARLPAGWCAPFHLVAEERRDGYSWQTYDR